MTKYIKMYALEIYTLVSAVFLFVALAAGNLSVIQKFVLIYVVLFVMHEWEEGRFPGGFLNLIADHILCQEISEEKMKASRIPAAILLLGLTIIPFYLDHLAVPILVTAFMGFFEGIIHIVFIKLMALKKPYSPGMVTAEMELLTSVVVFIYLRRIGMASGLDYVLGFIILILCYMMLQKALFAMIGIPYREFPKLIKARIKKLKEMKQRGSY